MFTITLFILLAGFVSGKDGENTQSTEWLSDCLNELTPDEISEFSELAHALALRSTRLPSAVQDDVDNALRRRKRDGGYDGGGKCGTFVLFPFLAFLYSATSTSVSVMNTINNSNDNNNNNNNENMNMNMNMNARKRRRRREDDPTKREGLQETDDLEETVYGSPETVPGLSGIFSSDELSANLREIRRNLGQEIDKFQLPGLPSVGELRGRLGKKFNWPRLTPNGPKTSKDTVKTPTRLSDNAAAAAKKSPVIDKKDTASSEMKPVFDAGKDAESKDNDSNTEKKEDADTVGKIENTDTLKNRAGSANDDESEEETDLLSGFLPQLSDLLLKQPAEISKLLPTSFKLSENRFSWTPLAELMFPMPGRSRIQATEVAEILRPAVNNIKDLEKFLKKMVSTPGINGEVLGHLKLEIDRRIKGLTSRGESKGGSSEDPTRSEPAEAEVSDQFKRAIDISDLQGGLNELRDEKALEDSTGAANSINEKKKVPGEFSLASLIDPTFQETVWNNSLSIPFFKEITEDISKVGELLQNSSLANFKQQDFDHKFRENLENLHLTSRVKNASEEIKKFKLPGLPSIGEILNDSLNMSSQLLSLPSLTSPISVLSEYLGEGSGESSEEEDYIISEKEKTDPVFELIKSRSALLRSEEKKDIVAGEEKKKEEDAVGEIGLDGMESLEELLLYRLKSVFDDGVIKLRYSLDEATKMFMSQDKEDDDISFDPTQAMKNLSISILQGIESLPVPVQLEGMFNPQEDVENLERVIRLAPMMVPYIMQDYKDRLAGLVVGTKVSQEQLFEIHSSLIDWHTKIDSVREELPGGGIHHVLGKLQENNLSLLSLLLHLMTEAGENGEVSLTHHHLNVLDRHLLKAEDLFPGLKNFL